MGQRMAREKRPSFSATPTSRVTPLGGGGKVGGASLTVRMPLERALSFGKETIMVEMD